MIVYHLATGVDCHFFEPMVVSFYGGDLETSLREKGVKVFQIGTRSRFLRIGSLVRIIKRLKVDLVHTHLTSAGYYGRPAAWLTGKWVAHTHHSLIFQDLKTKRLVAERMLAPMTDQSVSVSEAVARHLQEHLGTQAKYLMVIPNGIEPERFLCQRDAFNTPPVITACGRLEPVKSFDLLLEALAVLRVEGWDFHFHLIGDGSQMRPLRSQCQTLGLMDRTTFTGYVKDVAPFLKKSDVYVSSSYREGLSIALLEALAAGLPVVATNVGGNPEVLKDIGRLIPPGNVNALAQAIRNVLNDQVKALSMGQAGRERVLSRYTIRKMIESYQEVYCELLSGKK